MKPANPYLLLFGTILALLLAGCGDETPITETATLPFTVTATAPTQDAEDLALWRASEVRFELSDVVDPLTAIPTSLDVTQDGLPVAFTLELEPGGTALLLNVIATALGAPIEIRLLPSLLRASDGAPIIGSALNPLRFTTEPGETQTSPPPVEDLGRFLASIVRLADGPALVTGGLRSDGVARNDAVTISSDLTVTPIAAPMGTARWSHGSVRLPDGRVLVAGGATDGAGATATDSAELFDPTTQLFSPANALGAARAHYTFIPTIDGVPVVIGGLSAPGGSATTDIVEAWDDALQEFQPLDEVFPAPVGDCAVAPMADGNLFVCGGVNDTGVVQTAAFIVEPADGDVEPVANPLGVGRRGASACLLPTGHVLIVGGEAADGSKLDSLEVFDPETEEFRTITTATLGEARSHIRIVTLTNGVVAFVGGTKADTTGSDLLETFDPVTETIASTFQISDPLTGHVTIAAANGGLLGAYGAEGTGLPPITYAAIRGFTPAALGSNVPAPRVTSWLPATASIGVDADSNIVVNFSRPILASTISATSFLITDEEGRAVEGTRTVAPDGLSVTFDPTHPLGVLQRIDCEITTTVTDALGAAVVDDQARKAHFETIYDMVIGSQDDGSQFGYAARSGDVNGDGIDDLVISAYVAESVANSGTKEGQIAVILGRSSWSSTGAPIYQDLASATGAADLIITCENHLDQPAIEGALAVGDIDDDGYDDIVFGAHFADGPNEDESQRGEVWVIFGQETLPASTLQLGDAAVTGFDLLRVFGTKAGDKIGEGLALGDVDNDGKLDIVTGATGDDGAGGSSTGAFYVLFGDTKANLGIVAGYGEDTTGPSATNIDNIRIFGVDSNDRIGWSCACADFDNDGYADFAAGGIGADGNDNMKSSAGELIFVFGAQRSTLIPTGTFASYEVGSSTLRGFVIHGEDGVDLFGWSCLLDDFDGDGRADLAVGATSADGPGNLGDRRGEVLLVFGVTQTTLGLDEDTPWKYATTGGSTVFTRWLRVFGGDDKHSFGDALLFADVDGNGSKDLLVGDFQARGALDKGGSSCCWGEISVIRGTALYPAAASLSFELSNDGSTHPTGVTLTRFYGPTKGDRAGTTLAVGDFNDDGRLDLLTGANKARGLARLFKDGGEAYVLFGRDTWWK